MSADLKGRAIISDSEQGGNEVRVINGRLLVRSVTRTLPSQEGYGESSIRGGIAIKGEAVVTPAGALRVSG